ncbi:DUF6509 family protein [Paenisporosarcina cavernae]|uniref:Pullulanase n=1 Tax=Paenisporosarcina cavernae TaxID=2320858 RepID=A0A385YQF6_9BACL|nr:DUF6509 family protein [Paenisporosarcina cavernae]AYC28580.1 pullulanase [Paenisporosarcina cavernae]
MMEITQYSVEEIHDPTGIIEGKRYEFLLDIEVDEEDELFQENGVELRAIIGEKDGVYHLVQHFLLDRVTTKILDFELEDEEVEMVVAFCKEVLLQES